MIATQAGSVGNVAASAITGTPLTSIGYPLVATNGAATAGGTDAGSQSSALAQFTAKAASLEMGQSENAVGRWERRVVIPSEDQWPAIAEWLGVDELAIATAAGADRIEKRKLQEYADELRRQ